jgi:GT2 family glycosyltransferase
LTGDTIDAVTPADPIDPQDNARPAVAVVVLNYNGLEDTLRCLESLRAIPDPFRLILVDNASAVDPRPPATEIWPGITTIRNAENLGYAGGNNRGLEAALAAGAEYVLVLNNDTVVDPTIVRKLADVLRADDRLGIVGPVINFMDEPAAVMTDGVVFNPGPGTEFFKRVEVPTGRTPPALVRVDIVNGCCMMLRASMLKAVGLFDEGLFIVHEESDLCLRAARAGYQSAVLGESLVLHKGSSAFERTGRQLQRYFDARNLLHLLRRHTGRVSSSRRLLPSLRHYGLYAFYRYDVEMEAGKPQAAAAVAEGVHDALLGRVGPYRRWASGSRAAMRWTFGAARSLIRSARRLKSRAA